MPSRPACPPRTRPAPWLLAAALMAGPAVALAQSAPAAPARPATPAAAPAKPAAQAPAARPAARPAPASRALPAATPEQLDAAQLALYGDYDCEFDQKLKVSLNASSSGYVDVAFKGRTYVMKPVLSSTGALRLEDVTGRTLMIQIAQKSMLMDTKLGQRLVDECVHPTQKVAGVAPAPAR